MAAIFQVGLPFLPARLLPQPELLARPVTTGVGSSAGAGAASAVGVSTFSGVATSAGVGAAPGVGAETAAGVGSAAGVGAAPGVGAETDSGVGTAAGAGSAAGVGAETAAAVGTSAGVGAASGVSPGTTVGIGTSSGVGAASAVGNKIIAIVGTSAGVGAAAATGVSTFAGVGTSAGVGAAAAVGVSVIQGTGTAAGVGAATAASATGSATNAGTGISAGVSAAPAVGVEIGNWIATAAGHGAALGAGAAIVARAGTAAGVGSALAVAQAVAWIGSAAGTSTATAVGTSVAVIVNIQANLAAWFNHSFVAGERCSNAGNAYQAINGGPSTVAPTGTAADVAPGGGCHFMWLSAIDYTSTQAWWNATPGTWTTSYIVQHWNNGEVVCTGSTGILNAMGKTTGSFTWLLSTAPGESLRDKPGSPAFYNPANGVAFRGDSNIAFSMFYTQCAGGSLDGLQCKMDASTWAIVHPDVGSNGVTVSRCLLDAIPAPNDQAYHCYFPTINCNVIDIFIVDRRPANSDGECIKWDVSGAGKMIGCTIVAVNGPVPVTGEALKALPSSTNQVIVRNTAFYGYITPMLDQNIFACFTFDHCITDQPSFNTGSSGGVTDSAGFNLYSKSAASQLVDPAADLRPKLGAATIRAGVVDIADVPDGLDFYRNAWGTAPDIGPVQFSQGVKSAVGRASGGGEFTTDFLASDFAGNPDIAVGASIQFRSATAAGIGTATAVGASVVARTGTAAGVGAASGITSFTGSILASVGLPGSGDFTANFALRDFRTGLAGAQVTGVGAFMITKSAVGLPYGTGDFIPDFTLDFITGAAGARVQGRPFSGQPRLITLG